MERNVLWKGMYIRSDNEGKSGNPALAMVKEKKPKFEGRLGYIVTFRLPWSIS